MQAGCEFVIEQVFRPSSFDGPLVIGAINRGNFSVGDAGTLMKADGGRFPIIIASIHIAAGPLGIRLAGLGATLADAGDVLVFP
jgi:hypothetical protein